MKELLKQIDDAIDLVGRLASGDEKWHMRVPVDEQRDTDCVLVNTLLACKKALEQEK